MVDACPACGGPGASGRCTACGAVIPLDIGALVAQPGFAPRAWQAAAPRESWGSAPPVQDSPELRRILALPRRAQEIEGTPRGDALIEMVSARYRRPPRPEGCACESMERECIMDLRFAQAWALYEIGIAGGLLGPIGVGHGKTILNILSLLALAPFRVGLGLLLVPPTLLGQLVGDYVHIGQHFRVPSMIVHGGDDYTSILPGEPVLHVMPYSRLSRPTSTRWIEDLQPGVIIADEAHKLRDPDTATTSRVMRYAETHPETRFLFWSGSITDKTIKDYAHLASMALKHCSPVPRDKVTAEDWSRAIDPKDNPADPGALLDGLIATGCCLPDEHVTRGYGRRLNETCGVVSTTIAAVDAELVIDERVPEGCTGPAVDYDDDSGRAVDYDGLPVDVVEALARVREGERPDGELLLDALAKAKTAREVACGFYYYWHFPNGEKQSLIDEWKAKRKAWRKELRKKLMDRAEHLDSENLCKRAAQRHWGDLAPRDDLPSWHSLHWPAWRDIENQVVHVTRSTRINDYLARDAAAWALQNRGIVWYEHSEFGAWVAQLSGLPMYAGGPGGGGLLDRQTGQVLERGDRSLILSIKAHGTGRNGLQKLFCDQLVANPPSSPSAWEQLLGRLHRVGQHAPTVWARFYRHTREMHAHVDSALRAALYVEGTIGASQKIRTGFRLGRE